MGTDDFVILLSRLLDCIMLVFAEACLRRPAQKFQIVAMKLSSPDLYAIYLFV